MQNSDIDAIILEQAIDWLLRIEEQPLNADEQKQFEQWKNSSQRHQEIWGRVGKVRKKLDTHVQAIPRSLTKNFLEEQKSPWLGKLMFFLITGTIVTVTFQISKKEAWLADYRTTFSEQKRITLDDGTNIRLNSKTALDVNYTKNERNIILRYGEIYVETGKDNLKRPFKVLNQHGQMLALGTAFNVNQQKDQTILTVVEHTVEITTMQTKQKQKVKSKQKLRFNNKHISPIGNLPVEGLPWLKGLVTVNRISVKDIAEIIEKNYGVTVYIDKELNEQLINQIEISGSFPINDLDRTVALLESTYPIKISKSFWGNKLKVYSIK